MSRSGRKASKSATRSAAAKKAWVTRRERKLAKIRHELRDSEWLPTRDELADYIEELASVHEIDVSDLYRMYFGYEPRGAVA